MQKAFTLIELLITLTIISIMVTISIFALQGARSSSRDAKRKSDLETVRSGLEIYRSDCHDYPTSLSFGNPLTGDGSPSSCSGSNTYISEVPLEPQNPSRRYAYSRSSATSYVLCTALENPPSSGTSTTGCGSCGSAACNYRVTNP